MLDDAQPIAKLSEQFESSDPSERRRKRALC